MPSTLSSAQVAALVRYIDPLLQDAACNGTLPEFAYENRIDLVSAEDFRTGRRGTDVPQRSILQHAEYEILRLTIPAYLWGFAERYQHARKEGKGKLTRAFYVEEGTRVQEFRPQLALGGSPGSAPQPAHSHQQAMEPQRRDINTEMGRLSLSPEDRALRGSADDTGRGNDGAHGKVLQPMQPQSSANLQTQGERRVRGFNEIEEERDDVDMDIGRNAAPSKRKRPDDDEAEWEEPRDASPPPETKVVKGAKKRAGSSAQPHGNNTQARGGNEDQGTSGVQPRAPIFATNIRNKPPCNRCVERHLLCVEQLIVPEDEPRPTKKRRNKQATACYECAKSRHKCSIAQASKPGGKKGKGRTMISESEEDELEEEGTLALRLRITKIRN